MFGKLEPSPWAFEEEFQPIEWVSYNQSGIGPKSPPEYQLGYLYMGSSPWYTDDKGRIHWDTLNVPLLTQKRLYGQVTSLERTSALDPYPYRLRVTNYRGMSQPTNITFANPIPPQILQPNKSGWADVEVGQVCNFSLPEGQVVQFDHTCEIEFGNFSAMGQASWKSDHFLLTSGQWRDILRDLAPTWLLEGLDWWSATVMPILIMDHSSVIRFTVRYIGMVRERSIRAAIRFAPLAASALFLPRAALPSGESTQFAYLRQFVTATVVGITSGWVLDYLGPMVDPPPSSDRDGSPLVRVRHPQHIFRLPANDLPFVVE